MGGAGHVRAPRLDALGSSVCVCEGTETDRNEMTSLQAHSVAGGGVGFIPRWVCPEASVPNSGDVAGRASVSSTTLSSCPCWAWKAGCGHLWWKGKVRSHH